MRIIRHPSKERYDERVVLYKCKYCTREVYNSSTAGPSGMRHWPTHNIACGPTSPHAAGTDEVTLSDAHEVQISFPQKE